MAKTKGTPTSNNRASANSADINSILTRKVPLKCKNVKQKNYKNLILDKEITVCAGPAGVGKSYLAIAVALQLVQDTTTPYNRILIIKPAYEAEENLGFLPGNLKEKLEPHMASSLDIVDKIVTKEKRLKLEENDIIMVEPLGFIRGKSFDNSILIMEEAQNMSPNQMKTLLTRIGYNTKYIISGDLDQSDKYDRVEKSGLFDAMNRHANLEEFGFFEFDVNDIVRNPLITKILMNYKKKEDNE